MAYSEQHVLLRVQGSYGSIVTEELDHWSWGLRIHHGSAGLTEVKKVDFLNGIQAAVNTMHTAPTTNNHPNAWLKKLTCAYIDLNGRYVGGDSQPTTEYNYATPTKGNGNAGLPFSHAWVVTLRTDIDRGRGHVGRFYLPSGMSVDATGRATQAQVLAIANNAKTMIDLINGVARTIWSTAAAVSVYSKLDAGVTGVVTSVSVGRAPDTQRRRDNKIVESYESVDLVSTFAARDAIKARRYA